MQVLQGKGPSGTKRAIKVRQDALIESFPRIGTICLALFILVSKMATDLRKRVHQEHVDRHSDKYPFDGSW